MTCQISLCLIIRKNMKAKIPVFIVSLQALAPYVCRWLPCIIQRGCCGFGDYSFSTKLSTCQKGAFETLTIASSSPVSLGILNLNLKSLCEESSCSSPVSSEGGEHHLSHWHQNWMKPGGFWIWILWLTVFSKQQGNNLSKKVFCVWKNF